MRDSGEFERSTGGESYEWSIPTAPDRERSYRMFVSVEADLTRLICVEECPVTSDNPGARRMEVEGVPRRSVMLTLDDARWLMATRAGSACRSRRARVPLVEPTGPFDRVRPLVDHAEVGQR
jgi:hypothetical protein